MGKTKQKKMNKESVSRANKIGMRIFMDINSIKHKSAGGAKFCALFIDDCSNLLINKFLKKKSDLAKVVTILIKRLKTKNKITVSNIRCDNAGENKKIKEMIWELSFGIL